MDPEPTHLLFIENIDWPVVIIILVLIGLLMLSALISAGEVAFFSLSKSVLHDLKNQNRNQKIVVELLNNPAKLLTAIQIFNNFINILFILIFAYYGDYFFGGIQSAGLKFFLQIVLVTFLLLLFGEVIPRVYANRNALSLACYLAKSFKFLNSSLAFLSLPIINISRIFERKLNKKNSDFNIGSLSEALALTSKSATTKEEKNILNGIVNFGNTETSEVMCPRMDIFAISIEDDFSEILNKIINNGHSRVPVYEENLDNIVGILYIKDLIPHLNKKTFNWQTLIRKAFFIPENKKLDDLLKEFQEMKNHLAIVVDEYGGTSGIITLEDVIEEIVGDISDEFDEQDLLYTKIDDFNYLFEGKISLKDFFKITKINHYLFEPYMNEAETLAGMMLEITGRYPKLQEKISVGNFLFSIESIDNKRIKQIKLTLPVEKNK